jgi:hypothetical protein
MLEAIYRVHRIGTRSQSLKTGPGLQNVDDASVSAFIVHSVVTL